MLKRLIGYVRGVATPADTPSIYNDTQAVRPSARKGGPRSHWAERWGLVRYLPIIDTVRRVLEKIGGRL